jgi:hypothetical protein
MGKMKPALVPCKPAPKAYYDQVVELRQSSRPSKKVQVNGAAKKKGTGTR